MEEDEVVESEDSSEDESEETTEHDLDDIYDALETIIDLIQR